MKKLIKLGLISLFCIALISACEKEDYVTAEKFGFLNINNQTSHSLVIAYNNNSLKEGVIADIKIPAGKGLLSFKSTLNKSLLDTLLDVKENQKINLVLFQLSPDVKAVLLENNQAIEPAPEAGYIKIKLANFAPNAFPKPVDVIFYWTDPDTFEGVEGGKVENVTMNFKNKFDVVLFKENTYGVGIKIVDSETKNDLLVDGFLTFEGDGKRVFTAYLSESKTNGAAVINSDYKVSMRALFSN